MGNAVYGNKMTCYDTLEQCTLGCGHYECVHIDKCYNSDGAQYACLPIDLRFFLWILVGIFLVVVLVCSSIVACYAIRAIRATFRNSIQTDGDVIFYNARNVNTFPHPSSSQKSFDEWNQRPDRYYQRER
ncbi:hypothetical protein M3Y96_00218900 [Aphelenchoides besseyi]|nr:hypothetical protein M3Y94_00779100 [Aphelenchoides besseyi]KAI6209412.1 hypothetical protein M3Y96_00218900 [Aphelenchoides besseyi]KAI6232340.1 hypothetical protein M3Y95_00475800 [Aphelenchoides besseyi]